MPTIALKSASPVFPFFRTPDEPTEAEFIKTRFYAETVRCEYTAYDEFSVGEWLQAHGYEVVDRFEGPDKIAVIAERQSSLADDNRALRQLVSSLQEYTRHLEEDRNQWKAAYNQMTVELSEQNIGDPVLISGQLAWWNDDHTCNVRIGEQVVSVDKDRIRI